MSNSINFEGKERRIEKINNVLNQYNIESLERARDICKDYDIDVFAIVKGVQPIAFDNACWAYTVGCAIAIQNKVTSAPDAAKFIGIGLESFCIPG